ncbi:hypothetical protein [Bosea vaviloviae]|uniref:hypothetical protein n=1 Tax=Bosea vaviloviae TaxID=1526658 RepID=UPI0011E0273B|nr:hypothetical protein [Bosea vaviloviae]
MGISITAAAVLLFSSQGASYSQGNLSVIQIGDLIFEIPIKVDLSPSRTSQTVKFDYNAVVRTDVPKARQVDAVFIKLENILPEFIPGVTFSIRADSQAVILDNFCRSRNRIGEAPNTENLVRVDGDFYVFHEKLVAGEVYMSSGKIFAFGAPATAWRRLGKSVRRVGVEEEKFYFKVALAENVSVSLNIGTEVVPRDKLTKMLFDLQIKLKSWVSYPSKAHFRWYHERAGC